MSEVLRPIEQPAEHAFTHRATQCASITGSQLATLTTLFQMHSSTARCARWVSQRFCGYMGLLLSAASFCQTVNVRCMIPNSCKHTLCHRHRASRHRQHRRHSGNEGTKQRDRVCGDRGCEVSPRPERRSESGAPHRLSTRASRTARQKVAASFPVAAIAQSVRC